MGLARLPDTLAGKGVGVTPVDKGEIKDTSKGKESLEPSWNGAEETLAIALLSCKGISVTTGACA